jgi:hypothetical protein
MPPPWAGAQPHQAHSIRSGDRVQIYWDGEGQWFCAFVEEVAPGGRVRVKYEDDDEVHWEDVNDLVPAPVLSIHPRPHGAAQVAACACMCGRHLYAAACVRVCAACACMCACAASTAGIRQRMRGRSSGGEGR